MDGINEKVKLVKEQLAKLKREMPVQKSGGCFLVRINHTEGIIEALKYFERVRDTLTSTYNNLVLASHLYPEVAELNEEIKDLADECKDAIGEIHYLLEE